MHHMIKVFVVKITAFVQTILHNRKHRSQMMYSATSHSPPQCIQNGVSKNNINYNHKCHVSAK